MAVKLNNDENRSATLPRVRVTEQERELVEKKAQKMGMSISDFIRYCVDKQLEKGDK